MNHDTNDASFRTVTGGSPKCQLHMMAYQDSWPRSCPTCGQAGPCEYGYAQVQTEEGFYVTYEGERVGKAREGEA